MINRIILTGRITKDIELRQTNDGILFTYFTLAVNRSNSRENNVVDFIPCVAWRSTAELMKNYLRKGSLIAVEGRIEVFTSQTNGEYNTRVNVNVSQVHFLESKKDVVDSNSSSLNTNDFQNKRNSNNFSFSNNSQISNNNNNNNNNNYGYEKNEEKNSSFSNDNSLNEFEEIDFDDIKF